MALLIPSGLLSFSDRGDDWAQWLDALPRLVRDVVAEWDLAYDGAPTHGQCALVVPVRTPEGVPAVVKFAWPHDEEEHEWLGLQALAGNGTVRLYRADPKRHVMLLERARADEDLTTIRDIEACEIVAGLYSRIHIAPPPQLRSLTSYISRWNDDMLRMPKSAPIPRRLVEQSISLAHDFVSDPASAGTMIHGDLHYENVLAADREPWLVIDPKPMSGDPHYEVAPLLWNRWDEVVESGDVRDAVRRRFNAVVDTAGLDEDRARDWVIVREMHNAMWCVTESPDGADSEDREWVTRCIAITKAVQD